VTSYQAHLGISVLAGWSVGICLGSSLLTGIPAVFIGVMGGIHYQKRQMSNVGNDAQTNHYSVDGTELDRIRASAH